MLPRVLEIQDRLADLYGRRFLSEERHKEALKILDRVVDAAKRGSHDTEALEASG